MRGGGIIIHSYSQRFSKDLEGFIRKTGQDCSVHFVESNRDLKNALLKNRPAFLFSQSDMWYEMSPYMLNKYVERFQNISVVVFAYERLTPARAAAFIYLGADSFIDMSRNDNELVTAFNRVLREGYYLPPELDSSIEKYHLDRKPRLFLTDIDFTLFRLLALGNSVEEIAVKTNVVPATVRNRIQDIHTKIGVHSPYSVIGFAIALGCVSPGEMVNEEMNHKILELEAHDVYVDGRKNRERGKRRSA